MFGWDSVGEPHDADVWRDSLEGKLWWMNADWTENAEMYEEQIAFLKADIVFVKAELHTMHSAAEMLWSVVANVSGGDWSQQTPEWQKAAARWRDYYFAAVEDLDTRAQKEVRNV